MQLQVETTAVCNAACVFCPYPMMKRVKGKMDMTLFRKIIDEAVTIPHINHLTLTGLGEPLLDPQIADRVRYAREHSTGWLIDLYTNGSYLTESRVRQLVDAGLSVLYVSLNAVTADKRSQIMGLDDFDKVVAQIDKAKEVAAGKMRIIVKSVMAKDLMESGESTQFQERWGGSYDQGGDAFLHLEGNWAGAMWPMRVRPTTTCNRALDEIMVMWDGRVSLCCFDGEGEVVFGDLNKQTIREVFNGEKATEYRKAHWEGKRGELKLCATCTAI